MHDLSFFVTHGAAVWQALIAGSCPCQARRQVAQPQM
jgi:hypothetical protein